MEDGRQFGEWRDVVGFENSYEISSTGRVRNKRNGRILSNRSLSGAGYVKADLWKNGKRHQTTAHILVANAFLVGTGTEVNHKNGIKTDNRVENLEWCTRSENMLHSFYELGNLVKPVISFDRCGLYEEFPSVCAAVNSGFTSAHIYRCLRLPHRRHKGRYWAYKNDAALTEKGDA